MKLEVRPSTRRSRRTRAPWLKVLHAQVFNGTCHRPCWLCSHWPWFAIYEHIQDVLGFCERSVLAGLFVVVAATRSVDAGCKADLAQVQPQTFKVICALVRVFLPQEIMSASVIPFQASRLLVLGITCSVDAVSYLLLGFPIGLLFLQAIVVPFRHALHLCDKQRGVLRQKMRT